MREEFNLWRGAVDGLQRCCKLCQRSQVRKSRYGIDEKSYQNMLVTQGNKCAACGDEFHEVPRVDHDHTCCPGQNTCGQCTRGLLCRDCNTALGMIKDNPDRALSLATYLLRFKNVLSIGG